MVTSRESIIFDSQAMDTGKIGKDKLSSSSASLPLCMCVCVCVLRTVYTFAYPLKTNEIANP